MRANWQTEADEHIAAAVKDLPADATLARRRGALNKAAWDFHRGTSHGKKTWSKHVRTYLEQHGLPPRAPKDVPTTSKLHAKLAAADITFPFRPSS